jgi:hypothetical protein
MRLHGFDDGRLGERRADGRTDAADQAGEIGAGRRARHDPGTRHETERIEIAVQVIPVMQNCFFQKLYATFSPEEF